MNRNPYIRPEAVAILGGTQNTVHKNTAVLPVESLPKRSLWGKIKDVARRVWGYIERAAEVVEEHILPVLITATGVLKQCSKAKRYAKEMAA